MAKRSVQIARGGGGEERNAERRTLAVVPQISSIAAPKLRLIWKPRRKFHIQMENGGLKTTPFGRCQMCCSTIVALV